jgi:hypothetical protein
MELTVERGNVVLHDSTVAAGAFWREHVEVVVAAVGLAFTFVEAIVTKLLAALGAEKVLGMPGLVEGGDTFLRRKVMKRNFKRWVLCKSYVQNGPIAVSAPRAKQVVVVSFAVWCTIALEEVSRAQLLVAVIAREMLRVPGFSQRRDNLSDNRLVAGAAAALLHSVDSLTRHVCLETTKHIL